MKNQPIFFIDRCLGKRRMLDALQPLGFKLELHDDHFAQTTLDLEWLPEIGKRGWVILTKDAAIARRHLERQAVTQANGQMFMFVSQNLSSKATAEAFRLAMPAIQKFLIENPAPFIAKVYRDSTVEAYKTATDLLAELES